MSEILNGIDLNYRPKSYFWPIDFETRLISRIRGARRRAIVKQLIAEQGLDAVPPFLAKAELSESERKSIARIHPSFLGGEFLPPDQSGSVEIARITLASVTQDVLRVMVRQGKHRLLYRIEDEYDGETLGGPGRCRSEHPLTLGELDTFLCSGWDILSILIDNFTEDYRCYPKNIDDILGFVDEVDSDFYPQLSVLYYRRIEEWGLNRFGAYWMENGRDARGYDVPS